MKVIAVDNYDRELFNDEIIETGLNHEEGKIKVEELNNSVSTHGPIYYRLVKDDYKLFERDF